MCDASDVEDRIYELNFHFETFFEEEVIAGILEDILGGEVSHLNSIKDNSKIWVMGSDYRDSHRGFLSNFNVTDRKEFDLTDKEIAIILSNKLQEDCLLDPRQVIEGDMCRWILSKPDGSVYSVTQTDNQYKGGFGYIIGSERPLL